MSSRPKETPVHLVVLTHGLWGDPKHLHTLSTLLLRSFGSRGSIATGTGGKRKKQQVGPEDVDSTASTDSSASSRSADATDDDHNDPTFESYIAPFLSSVKESEMDMDVVLLNSMSNKGAKTYDGIDWIAERVVREIKAEQVDLQKQSKYVARFSIVGYSLGGLVARYVVALLDSNSFFTPAGQGIRAVQARQFTTFATPHVGIPPASNSFGRLANYIGGRLLSRTGEQLYMLDSGWESGEKLEQGHLRSSSKKVKVGLIESMAKPESTFIRALNRFDKIVLYGNAVNDITVPFRTGCVEEWDPFLEQRGNVNVETMPDTPVLISVEPRKAPPRTAWQKIHEAIPSVPFFLNPRRLPFKAPYNYLAIIGFPILFPTLVVLIIYRFASESRQSRARILKLDQDWDVEEGKGKGGRYRIDRLVREVVMSVGEDRVDDDRSIMPTSPTEEERQVYILPPVYGRDGSKSKQNPASPLNDYIPTSKKTRQPALQAAQKRIVRTLNDSKVLPRLEKRWAYFDDVVNSHAIIVCRMPSLEPHRRGLPLLKHFVDDFAA